MTTGNKDMALPYKTGSPGRWCQTYTNPPERRGGIGSILTNCGALGRVGVGYGGKRAGRATVAAHEGSAGQGGRSRGRARFNGSPYVGHYAYGLTTLCLAIEREKYDGQCESRNNIRASIQVEQINALRGDRQS